MCVCVCVCVCIRMRMLTCVCMYVHIPTPSHEQKATRLIFKLSLTGLNPDFSSSLIAYKTKVNEPSLPNYFPMTKIICIYIYIYIYIYHFKKKQYLVPLE